MPVLRSRTTDPAGIDVCGKFDDLIDAWSTHIMPAGHSKRPGPGSRLHPTLEEACWSPSARTMLNEGAITLVHTWIQQHSPTCD